MKPRVYGEVLKALLDELESVGYDRSRALGLIEEYSWFMGEYSLLRALLRSRAPVDELKQCLEFYLVKRYEAVAEEVKPGSKVLDFGCGLGILSYLLSEKGCAVYGVDVDEDSIRVAARLCTKCVFQVNKPNVIPFESSKFDYVVFSWVLHDIGLDKSESIVSECRRVLREEGRVIVIDLGTRLDFKQLHKLMEKHSLWKVKEVVVGGVRELPKLTSSNAVLAVYQKK
ncbi:MAG: class I SAM-dependent methyltransferase [Desulfurococcaceae archaeon]